MFFKDKKDKPIEFTSGRRIAFEAALAAAAHISRGEIENVDYTFLQKPAGIESAEGHEVRVARVTGHFMPNKGRDGARSFVAEIYTRHRKNRMPLMETEILSSITIDGQTYRLSWKSNWRFRSQRWESDPIADPWRSSDEELRLDQVDRNNLSLRLECELYCLGIRTVGQLMQWTRTDLQKKLNDPHSVHDIDRMLTLQDRLSLKGE